MSFGGAVFKLQSAVQQQAQVESGAATNAADIIEPSFKLQHQALYNKDLTQALYTGEGEAIKDEIAMDEEDPDRH